MSCMVFHLSRDLHQTTRIRDFGFNICKNSRIFDNFFQIRIKIVKIRYIRPTLNYFGLLIFVSRLFFIFTNMSSGVASGELVYMGSDPPPPYVHLCSDPS